ncbi:hypothetical protein FKW77_004651 [Venturia effusa]|uniref:Secreted protein n=1 Tax=Venturia effusa TaxID=50376 RepID=A0A517LFD6_9PEZI|nr:hypothetical protein FKW77_004651 [Venturia effusa]
MLVTSYLATLLTLASTSAAWDPFGHNNDPKPPPQSKSKHCNHFMLGFRIKCDWKTSYCGAGEQTRTKSQQDADNKALDEAKKNFETWATGVGTDCGGTCNAPFKLTPWRYTGSTYYMDCFMARARKFDDNLYPEYDKDRLEVVFRDRKCSVFCGTDDKGQTCNFRYDKC